MSEKAYHVCMIHPFDPRGAKVGGIETYVRDYITHHPDDMELLLVGLDGFGDLELGKITDIEFRKRTIKFLPIMRHRDEQTNEYAAKLKDSLTLNFMLQLMAHWRVIRRYVAQTGATLELRRVEFAPFAATLGRPFIQMLHDGAESKSSSMSSLLKRYWFIKEAGDYLALALCSKFYCVNENLTKRLKAMSPRRAHKLGTLTTWADKDTFRPRAFDLGSETLKIVYAGRLDLFKNPALMFQTIAEVGRLTDGKVEFHYIGDGDTEAFPEFDAIRAVTVRHGRKNASEIADILSSMHIGILTSEFEGMPRFVMETLSAGRPVCALHLPQLEQVIREGKSGALIPRSSAQVQNLAARIVDVWHAIRNGLIRPDAVAETVAPFSPERLLSQIFADHRRLQGLPVRGSDHAGEVALTPIVTGGSERRRP
jgi:glycosyltransferase involved in cell wall biosynthesis